MPLVVTRVELTITTEDDVVLVRRRVRSAAQDRGFDTFATAAVTTAASELARNALIHARGGMAVVEEVSDGRRAGLRLQVRDRGPGIPDIARVMAGGYSTANSLGLGLSGSRRLVDEFTLDSKPGTGTVVTVVKWSRF